MREITDHLVEGNPNPSVTVEATDDPGPGGAHHRYRIAGFSTDSNPSSGPPMSSAVLVFQHGGIPENGLNGLTNEALLAVVIDRLRSFQDGPFPSQENASALHAAQEAMRALHKRTLNRLKRGVEGTMQA